MHRGGVEIALVNRWLDRTSLMRGHLRYADKQRGENKGKDLEARHAWSICEQQGDQCGWNRVRTMQGGDE